MGSRETIGEPSVTPGWYGADPMSMDLKTDPHGPYRALRECQPVNLTPTGDWRLSRYDDVQRLLKHSHSGVRDTDGIIPGETAEESAQSKFILRLDPPDHDRIRNLVSKAFTPRALNAIGPLVEPFVRSEIQRIVEQGHMDVATDLAVAAPAASMCAMLGVPFEDRHRLTRLVSLATNRLAKLAVPDMQEDAEAAIYELAAYMYELIEDRRKNPTDDILGQLVMAEEAGDRLSNDELLQQSIGLLGAGLETTIGLIGNSMIAFSRHPEQLQHLAENPELTPLAVEECLRFEPSIPITLRVLWEDTEFGGITIPKNSRVLAILIAANRDPEIFPDPDTFDIGRKGAKHCSFGGGIHFCLGSHLARLNTDITFRAVAETFEELTVDETQLKWAPSLFRVPGRLPAQFKLR